VTKHRKTTTEQSWIGWKKKNSTG